MFANLDARTSAAATRTEGNGKPAPGLRLSGDGKQMATAIAERALPERYAARVAQLDGVFAKIRASYETYQLVRGDPELFSKSLRGEMDGGMAMRSFSTIRQAKQMAGEQQNLLLELVEAAKRSPYGDALVLGNEAIRLSTEAMELGLESALPVREAARALRDTPLFAYENAAAQSLVLEAKTYRMPYEKEAASEAINALAKVDDKIGYRALQALADDPMGKDTLGVPVIYSSLASSKLEEIREEMRVRAVNENYEPQSGPNAPLHGILGC